MATKTDKKHLPGITVVHDMPDYHNDPSIIARVERARAFLKQVGLPKEWEKTKKIK